MTKPNMTPNPITIMTGILKLDSAPIAVEYIPRSNNTNDPLIPGNNIAVLAAQPDKKSMTIFVGDNEVIITFSAGVAKPVIASKAPTTSKIK